MLIRVLQQAQAAGAAQVFAAVEEPALAEAVTAAGWRAIMTGAQESGSARVAAAAAQLGLPPEEIVVNVQGDEPFIEPHVIRACAARAAAVSCVCATPCRALKDAFEYEDAAVVKVIADCEGFAMYFSRAAIPHQRDFNGGSIGGGRGAEAAPAAARAHLGLYAYRLRELRRFLSLPPAPAEQCEQLEQLRIIWHGGRIALVECESESFGVDTEEDLARARRRAGGGA